MFQKKALAYRGSRERLRKMVLQRGGAFLDNQKFTLPWRPSRYKELHTLTFQIRCQYEKNRDGFSVFYSIVPTVFSVIRMLLPWLLWGWALWDVFGVENLKEGSVLIVFGIVNTATQLWQWWDTEKEFVAKFTTETW